MNYELAKKLKDAGYSQKRKLGFYITSVDGILRTESIYNEMCYQPTLSELIEACDRDVITWRRTYYEDGKYKKVFGADVVKGDIIQNPYAECSMLVEIYGNNMRIGDSYEEAVANLWLELNKKQ